MTGCLGNESRSELGSGAAAAALTAAFINLPDHQCNEYNN